MSKKAPAEHPAQTATYTCGVCGVSMQMEQPAQQQEPVAWRVKVETKLRDGSVDFGYQLRNERLSKYDEPLYTSPPAQPQQEPVEWGVDWGQAGETPCATFIQRTPNGGIKVLAVEYGPPAQRKPQQEPVAWMYQCSADSSGPVLMQNKRDWAESSSGLWTETPLYKSPQPAQRKPLTDKEIYKIANDLFYGNGPCDTLAMCRAIEAAHGITKGNT